MKSVALLVESASSRGTGIIRGVHQFAIEQGGWRLFVEHRGIHEPLAVPYNWKGDGIIAEVRNHSLLRDVHEADVPVVNVGRTTAPEANFPHVDVDQQAVGKLAAEHLIERGIEQFAYHGPPYLEHHVDRVQQGFIDRLNEGGFRCEVYNPDRFIRTGETSHDDFAALLEWIKGLVLPVGMLSWSALSALRILNTTAAAGVRVPEQLALVSAEFDSLIDSITATPVSYVDQQQQRIGHEAAAMLSDMMEGQSHESVQKALAPLEVRARASTDMLALNDPELSQAMRFIRAHAHEAIQVNDVIESVNLSRRALEMRFNKRLGRSPAAEIRRIRIEKARRLLAETDIPVIQVAVDAGFQHPEVMQRAFRQVLGISPSKYRRAHHREKQEKPATQSSEAGLNDQ